MFLKTKLVVVIDMFPCKCVHLYDKWTNLRKNIKQCGWNEKAEMKVAPEKLTFQKH